MITEDLLKIAGYKNDKRTASIKIYCDDFFQKKVADKTGTKYFINFWHYPPHEYSNGAIIGGSWLFEMMLNEPHCTFEIHRPTALEFCERKAEEFWNMMGAVYYESNE